MQISSLKSSTISREGLEPLQHKLPMGGVINYFVDTHVDIVKIDFIFPAGSAVQEKLLQASTTMRLIMEGTAKHSARDIAEFMDFRGIAIDKGIDEVSATLTVYTLRRYLEELLPLLREIVCESVFPDDEFRLYVDNRRRHLQTEMKRTSFQARNLFYEHLYGSRHPMGQYAVPEDFDKITVDDVRRFYQQNYRIDNATIIIGGNIDNEVLSLFDRYFGDFSTQGNDCILRLFDKNILQVDDSILRSYGCKRTFDGVPYLMRKLPGAVQNTLRVGRLLPMSWDSMDYAHFMVLTTMLGGYFGSRLMSNIREDKGYTYGIYSQTRICRGSIVFSITTDVASENAEPALAEIFHELKRLCDEPVHQEELDLVRKCMLGDFMRSVDGIFERCERYGQQLVAGISERFTDNYFRAIDTVTPEQLQQIAKQLFRREELLAINVGVCEK